MRQTPTTVRQLDKLLQTIRAADASQVKAQLEIAATLSAIRSHKLYRVGDRYTSFTQMVQQELDFNPGTAHSYCRLYRAFTEFQYSMSDFTKLMRQFGWRRLEEALRVKKRKLGHRAVQNYLTERASEGPVQYNLLMSDQKARARLDKTLEQFGLQRTEKGTRTGLTDAFEAMFADYERLRALEKKRKPTRLRTVA